MRPNGKKKFFDTLLKLNKDEFLLPYFKAALISTEKLMRANLAKEFALNKKTVKLPNNQSSVELVRALKKVLKVGKLPNNWVKEEV